MAIELIVSTMENLMLSTYIRFKPYLFITLACLGLSAWRVGIINPPTWALVPLVALLAVNVGILTWRHAIAVRPIEQQN